MWLVKEFTTTIGEGRGGRADAAVEKPGTTIGLGYCFMSDDTNEDKDIPDVFVMHGDAVDALWAVQVERKGATEEAINSGHYNSWRLAT